MKSTNELLLYNCYGVIDLDRASDNKQPLVALIGIVATHDTHSKVPEEAIQSVRCDSDAPHLHGAIQWLDPEAADVAKQFGEIVPINIPRNRDTIYLMLHERAPGVDAVSVPTLSRTLPLNSSIAIRSRQPLDETA